MMTFKNGDRVMYRGAWGSEDPVPGTIVGWGRKNGRDIFDVDIDGEKWDRWGYADAFTLIENKPEPGKLYRLTGGPADKAISNGDSWADSEVEG